MKKRILTLLVTAMLLTSLLIPAAAAADSEAPLSRADFVTTLYRMAGEPAPDGLNPFNDVPDDAAYAGAVVWAAEHNIVAGTGDASFAPEVAVNREQAAVIMLNYAKAVEAGPVGAWAVYLDYRDVADISDWAFDGVMYAKIHGLIEAQSEGLFNPTGPVTLAEAERCLARLLEVTASWPGAETNQAEGVDYADPNNWLSFGGAGDQAVDLFVVYPTVASSLSVADIPYMRLNNDAMRSLGGEWLKYLSQIVGPNVNVYAPLYRQVNATTIPLLAGGDFEPIANLTPREDVFAAFAYFLENVNRNQRPFILLGHSQGGYLVAELATTFLGSEEYRVYNQNHIATYAIGVSVTPDRIAQNPDLQFSQNPADTGVILSWNTVAPVEVESGAYKSFITWRPGALTTNPLTWKTDATPAPAVPFNITYNGPYGFPSISGAADAIVDQAHGVLLVTTLDETAYEDLFGGLLSRYHLYDVWFFADSLTQNLQDRIAAFGDH